MKKIAILLIVALFSAIAAFAETEAYEPVLLEGVVTGITEEGYHVYEETIGEVMVLVNEETVIEATADISCGDYIYVDYNGQMTRSIPAQITATVLRMYKVEGDIIEHMPDDNSVMLNSAEYGEIIVRLPEDWADKEITDTHLTVYFNGAMTMSLPAQIGAGLVIPGYSVSGVITEIAEDYIVIGEEMSAIQANITAEMLTEDIVEGTAVRVIYNGQMTRSIPAQVNAISVETIVPAAEETDAQ